MWGEKRTQELGEGSLSAGHPHAHHGTAGHGTAPGPDTMRCKALTQNPTSTLGAHRHFQVRVSPSKLSVGRAHSFNRCSGQENRQRCQAERTLEAPRLPPRFAPQTTARQACWLGGRQRGEPHSAVSRQPSPNTQRGQAGCPSTGPLDPREHSV